MPGRLLLRHADGVVAISHAAAAFVLALAGREVPVVHRGVHADRLAAAIADPDVLAWAGGRAVVAFVGRLIDGKGVPDLLEAFAAVQEREAVLCIVGDGPRRSSSRRWPTISLSPSGSASSATCRRSAPGR